MGKARDEAGNIWETDAQGNPVRMLQPAQSNPMNNPFVDPRLQYQVQQERSQAAAAPYAAPKAQADAAAASAQARIAEASANVANAKNGADLQKAQLELEKLKLELANTQSGKGSALDALQAQVDRVGELYRQNLKGGVPNAINSVIPDMFQPGKSQFETAGQGLANPFMSAFRVPGAGSQSDTELRQFIEANVPGQGDNDAAIEEKLRNIQTRIDAERGKAGKPAQSPMDQVAQEQLGLATGQTQTEIDPALRAVGGRVGRMLADGVNGAAILKFMRDSGVDPAGTSIHKALHFRNTNDFRVWQRANPGKAYPIGPEFYTREVPMTDARALFNKTAATDAGGTAAAYAASAGNAVTGGRLDNLSGNPEMVNTGMELLRSQHPFASLGGDIAGQALVEGSLGRIPGAQAVMGNRWGRRGMDALYGAYSGSGEADSAEGGVVGALANAGGGMFGRSLQRGAGRALTGVRNANLGYLNAAGVPLTIGQIGRGSDNLVGHAAGGIEERALGLPGLDAVIGGARRRGDEGFNAAAFREAGGTGITGSHGVTQLQGNLNNAYSFLDPIQLPYDAPFAGSQAAVRANLPRNLGAGVADRMDNIDNAVTNGSLSGRSWQDSIRGVRADRASLRGQPFSDQAINSLDTVEGNLQDLALRQGPPGTAQNLANANRLNGQFQTILSALDNGPAQRADELFSASRLSDASRTNARNFGGRAASMQGNRPFYDLTRAGMEVMPNLTPDSGTAGRILLVPAAASAAGGLAGFATGDDKARDTASGGGAGLGAGIALAGLLSAPYSRSGQRIIQRALLSQRPRQIERLGEFLINNPQFGGMFGGGRLGSASARDFFYQPELDQ